MWNKPQVGVRYCGGCNARYNRVALVQRLAAALPEVELIPAQDGKAYPAVLVVHGCQARCTGVSGLCVPATRQIPLVGEEDFEAAKLRLQKLLMLKRWEKTEQAKAFCYPRPPVLLLENSN